MLFGAAYYHEYQPSPRLDTDLDLMVEAGFSVIRVGESVWTTWEPEEGRFDLEWLAPVLDGAAQRGIGVILGTPTYAAPPWLARRYPEIAGETGTGPADAVGRAPGDRLHPPGVQVPRRTGDPQDPRPATPTTRPSSASRSTTSPGCCCSTTTASSSGSSTNSARPTATSSRSTRRGGWSTGPTSSAPGRICGRPDGNWQPQYDLAWRTFQAKLTTEFIAWQAGIAREYARDDQFVTTCIAYERPTVDDANLTRALDVTAGNPYYAMQDGSRRAQHGAHPAGLDHVGGLEPVPERRSDVRLQAGARS